MGFFKTVFKFFFYLKDFIFYKFFSVNFFCKVFEKVWLTDIQADLLTDLLTDKVIHRGAPLLKIQSNMRPSNSDKITMKLILK